MGLYCFHLVLLCLGLILVLGPRPIFGDLMISYGFVWFSFGFAMFSINFNRRSSHDLRLSIDFPWFCMVSLWFYYFSFIFVFRRPSPDLCYFMIFYGLILLFYSFALFWFDLNRLPSPDLRLSYSFLWFCMVFVLFCYVLD